jgi:hypothetical protein
MDVLRRLEDKARDIRDVERYGDDLAPHVIAGRFGRDQLERLLLEAVDEIKRLRAAISHP